MKTHAHRARFGRALTSAWLLALLAACGGGGGGGSDAAAAPNPAQSQEPEASANSPGLSSSASSSSSSLESSSSSSSGSGSFVWTPIVASSDTRRVYLSSAGNDANDCLSEAAACRTQARAISRLRTGYPDHLLIRRGDVFDGSLSTGWALSGRSATEPMVVATYGTASARPRFRTGTGEGLFLSIGVPVRHLHVMDLHFHAHHRDPNDAAFSTAYTSSSPTGITMLAYRHAIEDVLIEGCEVAFYGTSLIVHTGAVGVPLNNIRLRANNFHDAWKIQSGANAQGHTQGVFASHVDGLLLEQNVIEHNGGLIAYPNDPRAVVPPGLSELDVSVTWFGHQLYSDSMNRNVRLIDNVFANGDGVQLRSGGVATGNVFIRLVHGLTGGEDDDMGTQGANGFAFTARDNLFMEGVDLPTNSMTTGERAVGLSFTNTSATGTEVVGNTFLRDRSNPTNRWGVALSLRSTNSTTGGPVRAARVAQNTIVNWRGGLVLEGAAGSTLRNVVVEDNVVQSPGLALGRVTRWMGTVGPSVVWRNNTYDLGKAGGLWFDEDPSLSFAAWTAWVGETGSRVSRQTLANPNAKFEEAVAGPGASYEAAWVRLRQQTRWNWDPQLESRELALRVKADLGLAP